MNDGPTRMGDERNGRKPNGNGNAWLQWVNTILLIAVSSLLGLMWTSTNDRINKIEIRAENFARLERLEEVVRVQGLDAARATSRLDNMVERNREDLERATGRRR